MSSASMHSVNEDMRQKQAEQQKVGDEFVAEAGVLFRGLRGSVFIELCRTTFFIESPGKQLESVLPRPYLDDHQRCRTDVRRAGEESTSRVPSDAR